MHEPMEEEIGRDGGLYQMMRVATCGPCHDQLVSIHFFMDPVGLFFPIFPDRSHPSSRSRT